MSFCQEKMPDEQTMLGYGGSLLGYNGYAAQVWSGSMLSELRLDSGQLPRKVSIHEEIHHPTNSRKKIS